MSGILETFLILFNADTSKFDEGRKHVDDSLDKTQRNVSGLDKALANMGSSIAGSLKQIAAMGAGFLAIDSIIQSVNQNIAMVDAMNDFHEATGIAIEDLSALQDATELSGGTAEGTRASISNLARAFAEMQAKGASRLKPFFDELGISMLDAQGKMRDVMDVLPELAEKFEGMGKQESLAFGQKLGLDRGTILTLQKGRAEYEAIIKQQKEMGVVTKETAEAVDAFGDSFDMLRHVMRTSSLSLLTDVLPSITTAIDTVRDMVTYLNEHQNLVTGFFVAIGAAVAAYYLPSMIAAGAATIAATWPLIAIGAAVIAAAAAFALIYDDIMNFVDGNDSVLGQLVNEYPAAFKDISEAFEDYGAAIKYVIDLLGDFFNALLHPIEAIEKLEDAAVGLMRGAFGGIKWGANALADSVMGDVRQMAIEMGLMASNPLAAQTPSSIATNNQNFNAQGGNVSIAKVEVNTQATDADGIAKGLSKALSDQITQVLANMDDGVER